MSDWKQNLPHIIALAILLFALLLVLTKVGLIGCSTIGAGYCNVYYSIFGKPKILLVSDMDGPGMGDPVKLYRYLEDKKGLNVRKLDIDQLSSGMLDGYDVVIVDHARNIPSDKLKLFYDYVLNSMGRLVWVGDSGTVIGNRDSICRELDYTVKWKTSQGTKETSKTENICVSSKDLVLSGNFSSFDFSLAMKNALYEKAWKKLAELCSDAFGGNLSRIRTNYGYQCMHPVSGYQNVYFNWENEDDFKVVVNPWDRGKYQYLGSQETQEGVNFGRDILGVTFISDAYAVADYSSFYTQLSEIRDKLEKAHTYLVKCVSKFPKCELGLEGRRAQEDLENTIQSVKSKLAGDISSLASLAQQKRLANETSFANELDKVVNLLKSGREGLSANSNISFLDEARESLIELANEEEDQVIKEQLNQISSNLASYKSDISEKRLLLNSAKKENQCKDFMNEYSSKSGVPSQVLASLFSVTYDPTDDDLLDFIARVKSGYYEDWVDKLKNDKFCNSSIYLAEAIELARSVENPAENNPALATLKVEDNEHPLVQGLPSSVALKDKFGQPVPFVLVYTSNPATHVVASIDITPAYLGESKWPAILVRDPKYGSHIFGRGVVIYYAFPPETSNIFMENLVRFIMY